MKLRLAAALACAQLLVAALAAAQAAPAPPPVDARSRVILREDCGSTIGRREVTLFANGTVRVRQGTPGAEEMTLGELGRDEVEAFVNRLAEPDLSETDLVESAPDGVWVERCLLELALPGAPEREFRYGRYSTHSLALRTILWVVQDVVEKANPVAEERSFPPDYEPWAGDLLERNDGVVFELMGFTGEGLGVELLATQQPLTIYIPRSDVRLHFSRLLRRGRKP